MYIHNRGTSKHMLHLYNGNKIKNQKIKDNSIECNWCSSKVMKCRKNFCVNIKCDIRYGNCRIWRS